MLDPGKYKKHELIGMVKDFFINHNMKTFKHRLRKLKAQRFMKNHNVIYAIQPRLYNMLHSFLI